MKKNKISKKKEQTERADVLPYSHISYVDFENILNHIFQIGGLNFSDPVNLNKLMVSDDDVGMELYMLTLCRRFDAIDKSLPKQDYKRALLIEISNIVEERETEGTELYNLRKQIL